MNRVLRPLIGIETTCNTCGQSKDDSLFVYYKGRRVGRQCRSCRSLASIQWTKNNPDKAREIQNNYTNRNPERKHPPKDPDKHAARKRAQKMWFARQLIDNPQFSKTKGAKWRAGNPEKSCEHKRAFRKRHPEKIRSETSARRRGLRRRTPKWADKAKIHGIYANCPDGYEVDHIVPLRHPLVSGLHVPDNLQYLTRSENMKKGNRFYI